MERSGGGDPERTLALLWRAQTAADEPRKPARGRKPRLTVDEILHAAIEIADTEGLAATSMVRVAAKVGIGTMSIYTYVPGKAELIDLMVDSVLSERELPVPGERPADWQDQVRIYADRTWLIYQQHPWLRQISMVRPALGPGLLGEREYLLSALHGIGLSAKEVAAAVRAIISFVDASAAMRAEVEYTDRLTGQSEDAWWAARESFWEHYFDQTRYPTMTQVWLDGGFENATTEQDRLAYDFGLRQLLNGIQATIDARSAEGVRARSE